MTACGVNLRVEDCDGFRAACQKAGVDPASVPILAILHDDTQQMLDTSFRMFAGLSVAAWRCMSPNSQLAPPRLPQGAHIIGWNEADDSSAYPNLPSWVDTWWQQVRRERPDLHIHYGAPNVDGFLAENPALEAALDFVDRHIGSSFSPPSATIQGKPVWVTEVDIDPNRFDFGDPTSMAAGYAEMLGCMGRCREAGIPAFAWGVMADRPDAAYDANTIKAIVAMNTTQGGTTQVADETTQDAQIVSELDRETHLAVAAYAMAQMLNKLPTNMIDPALQMEYQAHINALDPSRFRF